MSRGVLVNSDLLDANLQPQLGPNPQVSVSNAGSSSSPSSDPHSNELNGNAAQGSNEQTANELERSPGPHIEEMSNGIKEEDDYGDLDEANRFMLVNGDEMGSGHSSQESLVEAETFDPDLRRVKVYELVGSQWTDRGTAFCQGEFDSDSDEARLIAKSEATQEVLLNCLIRVTDVYQRQQETLIVWTEPDGTDFALSFQDVDGCSEVWTFILEVQGHLNNREMGTAIPSTAAQMIQSGHLPVPTPDAAFILEIEKAMRTMARAPKTRETICNYILENKYIHQLLDAFDIAEKDENLNALHALCSCMQTILLFSEHMMYEHILTNELWFGVVGMLEYDPEFPEFKANYRDYLRQKTKFLQPIPIMNEAVQAKIHNTYKLQYLKDVILGRALDDSTFNVLNSCIIFNQIEIISHVQQDELFLTNLVSLFIQPPSSKGKETDFTVTDSEKVPIMNGSHTSGHTFSSFQSGRNEGQDEVERKKEVISLLQQLCVMGKNVQLPTRIGLFRILVERGVLYAVQWALCSSEKHLIIAAGEILSVLLDHHTLSVRNHIIVQAEALGQPTCQQESLRQEQVKLPDVTNGGPPPFKETLMQAICRIMANSQDFALQNQLADAIRLICDAPPPEAIPEAQANLGPKLTTKPLRDDISTNRFLENTYKVCVETLFRPLTHDVPDHHDIKDSNFTPSRDRGNLYLYLCDLLCSFVQQHFPRSYSFVLSSNVACRIASFLYARDKHLCLVALRFFRQCLRVNNGNLIPQLAKHEVYTPLIKLTLREAKRENLLSSACQEFFESIRKDNLKKAIESIMKHHEADIRELAKSSNGAITFQGIISRHEMNIEPHPIPVEKKQPVIRTPRLFGRVMEAEEEENYLLGDDSEEDQIVPVPRADHAFLGAFRKKRPRATTSSQANKSMRLTNAQQRPSSPLSSLLEYDDDDETGNGVLSDQEPSTPGTPMTPHRQIEILPYEPPEPSDPEDDLLESLVCKTADESQKAEAPSIKLREKRRRGEEEDDDAFEKLTPKNRRLSNASDDASQVAAAKARAMAPSAKPAEDGSKKLKLKFSMSKIIGGGDKSASKPDSKDGGNG